MADIVRSNLFTRFNALLGSLCLVVLIAGNWRDALFGGVLVANAAIGIVQELRAKLKLARLALLSQPKIRVLRFGVQAEVETSQLAAGDLIYVAAGDQIPADGTIVASDGLEIDESLLSGESAAVPKGVDSPVMSGSFVVAGSGTYRATAVGPNAYAQRLAAEAKRFEPTRSQLRAGIDAILCYVGWAIVPLSLLLLVNQLSAGASGTAALLFSAGGVVGMVPEGLVLLASVAMATGAMRLAARKALVQELTATETLARVDVLCLDKTGTLTTGKTQFQRLEVLTDHPDAAAALGALAATDPNPNSTLNAIGSAFPAPQGWHASAVRPFSAARKWSGATFSGGQTWVLGAPEVLLAGAAMHEHALRLSEQYACSGSRVLLLATSSPLDGTNTPRDLHPVALVLLGEEIKETAQRVLRYFADQGVTVKVISGDHVATASSVARCVDLANAERGLDATTLPESAAELQDAMERYTVFGRTSPQQKKAMVAAFQARGHTVAMIGDGVNDVLALKQADIGIAMGNGSGAARTVAQLVLVDSQFASLPSIVQEGRRIIGNVERLASLFVTKTVYAMLLAIAVGIADLPFPFLPRHLTLVGALTIGIPAFLLSMEPGGERVTGGFVARVLRFAGPAGGIAALVTFVTYFTVLEYQYGNLENARSMAAIALFCIATWALCLLSRPLDWFRTVSIVATVSGFCTVLAIPSLRTFFALSVPPAVTLVIAMAMTLAAAIAQTRLVDKLANNTSAERPWHGLLGGRSLTWQLVIQRIGIVNLLVASVLIIGGVWLFLGVLEDVVAGDPLVAADITIHATLQQLRVPQLDAVMVAASELGDAAVTVPLIFVTLGWFMWRGELRSAIYWIAAVALAEVFVETLKFIVHRPRPTLIYEGIQGFSFPSNHATLSVVTYGFLAFFVARAFQGAKRQWIAIATSLLIALISFSRLYLGVHWFSDVLAGVSFGVAWIAMAALLHHVGDGKSSSSSSLGMVAILTFLLSAGVHIFMQHGADLIRYAPR